MEQTEVAKEKKLRGFARLDPERRKEVAARGGASVPKNKRSFSSREGLASKAGKVGGTRVNPTKRSFYTNRDLAAEAGRKGGRTMSNRKRNTKNEQVD